MVVMSSGLTVGSFDNASKFIAKFSEMVFCFVAKIIVFNEPGISTV